MALAKTITRFGYVYLYLAGLFILFGYGCIIYFDGWWKFTDIVNPFNPWNYLAIGLTLLPGIGLIKLGTRLEKTKKGGAATSAR
jgi:hypothetical protein